MQPRDLQQNRKVNFLETKKSALLHFSATLLFSFSNVLKTMLKCKAGGADGCPVPRPWRLSAEPASQPLHGAEPRAAPWPLRCPKPSLPTSFDSVFPTSKAHPGTRRAPQQSAKLRLSRCSLFGTGRPHLPHQQTEISMAANVLQTKKSLYWLHSAQQVSTFAVPTPSPCTSFTGEVKRHLIFTACRRCSLRCTARLSLSRSQPRSWKKRGDGLI